MNKDEAFQHLIRRFTEEAQKDADAELMLAAVVILQAFTQSVEAIALHLSRRP